MKIRRAEQKFDQSIHEGVNIYIYTYLFIYITRVNYITFETQCVHIQMCYVVIRYVSYFAYLIQYKVYTYEHVL